MSETITVSQDTPGYVELKISENSELNATFVWQEANGVAVNLAGSQATMKIYDDNEAEVLSLTSSPAAGLTITDATGTIAAVKNVADLFATFRRGWFVLEILMSGDTLPRRLVNGPAIVLARRQR